MQLIRWNKDPENSIFSSPAQGLILQITVFNILDNVWWARQQRTTIGNGPNQELLEIVSLFFKCTVFVKISNIFEYCTLNLAVN